MCGGAHPNSMITCPNCGAGNKRESSVCRMCATPLEGIAEAAAASPVASVTPSASAGLSQAHQEEVKAQVEQEGIVCPDCNTRNEVGWSFCQQCGTRLLKPQPVPP